MACWLIETGASTPRPRKIAPAPVSSHFRRTAVRDGEVFKAGPVSQAAAASPPLKAVVGELVHLRANAPAKSLK
jgi:hypothetical protein